MNKLIDENILVKNVSKSIPFLMFLTLGLFIINDQYLKNTLIEHSNELANSVNKKELEKENYSQLMNYMHEEIFTNGNSLENLSSFKFDNENIKLILLSINNESVFLRTKINSIFNSLVASQIGKNLSFFYISNYEVGNQNENIIYLNLDKKSLTNASPSILLSNKKNIIIYSYALKEDINLDQMKIIQTQFLTILGN